MAGDLPNNETGYGLKLHLFHAEHLEPQSAAAALRALRPGRPPPPARQVAALTTPLT